ncbi:hypothetical protein D3C76_1800030 [compost metagenome]
MAVFTKVAQLQAGQVLDSDAGLVATLEHPRQETLHIRPDPVQKVIIIHPPYVGRAQRIVMR